MPNRSEWSVGEPQKLTFERPVERVRVRVSGGAVNIVGTDAAGPAKLEVSAIDGPPLRVTHEDGTLTVAYEDLTWQGMFKWLEGERPHRSVDLTVAVPADTAVRIGVVGATAVVSGIEGATEVRGVTGDTTLVGLGSSVRAETVSGNVEAQALTGRLSFASVSGSLTVVDSGGGAVRADSVSGDVLVDVAVPDPASGPRPEADLTLTTVSGDIAIRLPDPTDAVVDAGTKGGALSCAFENLRIDGRWGTRRVTGTLGSGRGSLKAGSLSGAVALLRRPPTDDGPTPPAGAASLRKDV